jgi:hypothetical protein
MTQLKNRNSFLSPEQLREMKMMLRERWSEVWAMASSRHHDEQRFAETQERRAKEAVQDNHHLFLTESGFRGRNRTPH